MIARAEGYGFAWQRVVLEPGQTLGPVDFALEKAAAMEGRVVNEQGVPVAGATVRIAYTNSPPVMHGWLVPEAETDATGSFRIRGVNANLDFYLEASHPRFPVRVSETALRAQPGQSLTGAVLTLRRGVSLTGRILDAAGNAVADAEVRLVAWGLRERPPAGLRSLGWQRELHRVAKTDANGQFVFEGVAEGKRMLIVRHPQFKGHEEQVELTAAASTRQIQLQPKTR